MLLHSCVVAESSKVLLAQTTTCHSQNLGVEIIFGL
jgi:hypothetical protein